MRFALFTSLAALLLSSVADAQQLGRQTYTLPWADGNTLIISVTTNALGQFVTQTLSTLGGASSTTPLVPGGVIPTTSSSSSINPLNPAVPVVTSSSSSSRRSTSTLAATATRPTTDPNRVQYDTSSTFGPPMRTTTYWYDPGGGVWTVATWTATITDHPAVATVIVPAGTVQEYNAYQSEINSNVLSSAQAAQTLLTNGTRSAGGRRAYVAGGEGGAPWGAVAGWMAMFVGMAGMGYGVLAL